MASGTQGLDGSSIAGIQTELDGLASRIRRAARRSSRFSWFSWGFLFALVGGELLQVVLGVAFPRVTTTTTSGGVSTMTSFPAWGAAVSLLPALVMLALAVRELLVGERESVPARVPSDASRPAGPEESAPGSVETVQQAQRLISHAKSETEFSFVPLFLGVYGAGALAGSEVVGWLAPSAGAFTVLVSSVVAVPCLLALWPLYRIANRWIGGLQRLLDRQVGELTRLETEFLWRFAGTAVPE